MQTPESCKYKVLPVVTARSCVRCDVSPCLGVRCNGELLTFHSHQVPALDFVGSRYIRRSYPPPPPRRAPNTPELSGFWRLMTKAEISISVLVFTEVGTRILVLWVVTPCILVAEHRSFGWTYLFLSAKVIQVWNVAHCINTGLIYSLIWSHRQRHRTNYCRITPLLLCSPHSVKYKDLGNCFRKRSLCRVTYRSVPAARKVRCVQCGAGSTRYRQINTNAPNELAAPCCRPLTVLHMSASGFPATVLRGNTWSVSERYATLRSVSCV